MKADCPLSPRMTLVDDDDGETRFSERVGAQRAGDSTTYYGDVTAPIPGEGRWYITQPVA